ncbi:MAG TPA: Y-family DNA polymerase [Candidatus Saccharimonadales bacterium]|nr:Y-family DNA polymerase [Candidatus Saccharimonadales bacterium]
MKTVFALIDCNNFFVSCERLFRPDLEGKPVVVLSSNDGCIVARSNEVKKLAIPMGAPAFKYRQAFKQNKVVEFSANFEIYGDISKRITAYLMTVTPRIEVYSVDESFLDLSSLPIDDYAAWGRAVVASIRRYIGVPVSIGIAPSKTLAKLAAEMAKQNPDHQGAVDLINIPAERREALLGQMPIHNVWGVGWRTNPKLRAEGISTALAMAKTRPQHAQQLMGIAGRKMVAELNGTACYPLELEGKVAQSIERGRTFGEDTNQMHVLESAIANMTARAAFALRREKLLAKRIGFFTNTNHHKPGYRQWWRVLKLDQPTNDTGLIISMLTKELDNIFSSSQMYHRLGIYLSDFVPETALQTDLLGHVDPSTHDRASARMRALDEINHKFGRHKMYYAAQDLQRSWEPKYKIRSPRYLSEWNELPVARVVQ